MNSTEESFSTAFKHFSCKNYISSLADLTEAEKYNKLNYSDDWKISIENLKGFNYLALDRIDDARSCFEEALHLDEKSSQACAGLAEIFFINGQDKESKVMFEYALFNNPENKFAKYGLAKVNNQLRLPENHISSDDKQDESEKDKNYRVVLLEASKSFSESKFNETVDHISSVEKALEKDFIEMLELITEVSNMKGTAYLELNQLEKAKDSFEKALNIAPESSTACWGLAEVFFKNDMFNEAKTMYEWALLHNENNRAAKEGVSKAERAMIMNPNEKLKEKYSLRLASGKTINID